MGSPFDSCCVARVACATGLDAGEGSVPLTAGRPWQRLSATPHARVTHSLKPGPTDGRSKTVQLPISSRALQRERSTATSRFRRAGVSGGCGSSGHSMLGDGAGPQGVIPETEKFAEGFDVARSAAHRLFLTARARCLEQGTTEQISQQVAFWHDDPLFAFMKQETGN